MTTATQTPEAPEQTIDEKIAAAQTRVSTANVQFGKLVSGDLKSLPIEEQLKVPAELSAANAALAKLNSAKSDEARRVKTATLEQPVATIRDQVKNVLTRVANGELMALMTGADVGRSVVISASFNVPEDGAAPVWSVSTRFATAPVAKAPSSGTTGTPGTRARVKILADGKEFTPTEYLNEYLAKAISDNIVQWGTFEERIAYTQDHSKRARELAAKLSHTVQQ